MAFASVLLPTPVAPATRRLKRPRSSFACFTLSLTSLPRSTLMPAARSLRFDFRGGSGGRPLGCPHDPDGNFVQDYEGNRDQCHIDWVDGRGDAGRQDGGRHDRVPEETRERLPVQQAEHAEQEREEG